MKKSFLIIWAAVFCVLVGKYCLDPNRLDTREVLKTKGAQTSKDYMLSSLNVTAFARDKRELMWIGTSAGINVYDGKDYIQFFHDVKDTAALPDDYINTLHLDRKGRMWVGTQNGLARYAGAYRFHRVALPATAGGNIVAMEDAKEGLLVSDGKNTYLVKDNDEVEKSDKWIKADNMEATLPADNFLLRKPRDLVVATYKDLGDNLWVGYRNAGYQIISQNRIAYKYANRNPLALATAGKDVISLAKVGQHILAGTTLRLYVYDTQAGKLGEMYYRTLFDSVPSPEKLAVNYIVSYDDQRAWLVGNRQVISSFVSNEQPEIVAKSPQLGLVGCGVKNGDHLYVSSDDHGLLRFSFADPRPASIPIDSKWFDSETQLTTLRDGDIFLFMKNMHLGIFSPKTGRWQELKASGIPDYASIDPAFVREDSDGHIWLGTKRYGLYYLDRASGRVGRVHSLNDVHVQGLVEDGYGQMWVTTLRDAFCVNPKMRTLVMNGLVSSSQGPDAWQFFDNSICLAPNGDVVFGCSDGCKFLSAPAMNTNFLSTYAGKHAGRVLSIYSLETESPDGDLKVIDECVTSGSRYTFAHDENTIRLRYFYPNFSRRSALMYQCKMEGLDQAWRQPSYQHEMEFQDLAPGKYTFRLRLISSPNVPALQERKVEIIILPSPWTCAAAWYLYFSMVLGLLYYVNSLYLRERSNHLLLLQEQQDKEREKRANEMNMNFFANISHEFRNPITIIAGPLLALTSDKSLPESVHRTLNRVCISVNRMLRLIDQMLDFNQLETDALRLKVSEVDAAEEIRRMAEAFEESTKARGILLQLVMGEGDYRVWIDSDKLEKIVSNLFTNALKHTPSESGIIRISTSVGDGKLEVAVYNNGEPISEEKLQDVFKRYYQLADRQTSHRYGWGTGIGLYYVKRLVGLHHGEISVRNVEGGGVEFRFFLPTDRAIYNKVEIAEQEHRVMQIPLGVKSEEGRVKNPTEVKSDEGRVKNPLEVKSEEGRVKKQRSAAEGKANPTEVKSDEGRVKSDGETRRKILVVDDDIDVAQYVSSLFADRYEVVNRYSAEEALKDLEEVRPDVILSDVVMGAMSGYEFCKTIKGNLTFSHIPVILITAKSNMDEQVEGLRLGAVAYVTKPFDPCYLQALVESQLQHVSNLRKRLGEGTDTATLPEQEADTLSKPDRKFMDELYALMEKRSAEMELNVSTICHDLLISQSKFNYKLKELTGETPGSFFRKYKLNKAGRMLQSGKYSVSEVATLTGFSTAAHFSVAFKKQFGVSPSEFTSSLS